MDIQTGVDLFLSRKESDGLADSTLEDYRLKLYRFVIETDIERVEDITETVISGYLMTLQYRRKSGELSSATVASSIRPIKVFCRWLANRQDPLLLVDPFKYIKVPKVEQRLHDVIDDLSARRLLQACDLTTHEGRRNHAMMCFMLDTGVRVGELTGLRHSDVDVKGHTATVIGKGDKQRQVFFSATTAASILRYTARSPVRYRHPDWLWTSIRRNVGGRFTGNGVQQMLVRVADVAGVTCRVNPHTFRHTFATNYLRAGGDLNSLMRLMGHADLTILQTYLNLVNSDLKAKHEQFSPLGRIAAGRRG